MPVPAERTHVKGSADAVSNPRLLAAHLVVAVLQQGNSLNRVLAAQLGEVTDPRQRALAQKLVYGTLRWYHRLEAVLAQLLGKPMKSRDRDLHALLLVGLYQLLVMEAPAHAAVSETVQATRALGKEWARGLVNGVLRNALRRGEALLAQADAEPVARWSHPRWWLQRVQQDWPQHWQEVMRADNCQPPMTLRVNLRQGSRERYLARLAAEGLQARPLPDSATALQLATPSAVDKLPGFFSGAVSVQDAAAQLCAPLLELHSGQRVLDACAAPGGKTGHILESAQLDAVLALDSDARRLEKVAENLSRLQLYAECVCADAGAPDTWWDGRTFERILLDAPCSASGVVRRHPDIKILRRDEDVEQLARQQLRLLEALWPLLSSGGILLYVTCSVFSQENGEVIRGFLRRHADARTAPIEAHWGLAQAGGRQLLPGEHGMDGFYFARLVKN